MKFLLASFVMISTAFSQSVDPRYFANQDVQSLSPEAFVLQPESKQFAFYSLEDSMGERLRLVEKIKGDIGLYFQIQIYESLLDIQKENVLRKLFALEVEVLNIKAPELIIDNTSIAGASYFDFEINNQGPGRVILNPSSIAKDKNPYLGLLLLIHETRHSAQIQRAFSKDDDVAKGYKAAFIAQKKLKGQIKSFSDFLTLNNEYEAFSFGNYVVTGITNGQVKTLGLGTFASQYDANNNPKIDLKNIFNKVESGEIKRSVLEEFNIQEEAQYRLLKTP